VAFDGPGRVREGDVGLVRSGLVSLISNLKY